MRRGWWWGGGWGRERAGERGGGGGGVVWGGGGVWSGMAASAAAWVRGVGEALWWGGGWGGRGGGRRGRCCGGRGRTGRDRGHHRQRGRGDVDAGRLACHGHQEVDPQPRPVGLVVEGCGHVAEAGGPYREHRLEVLERPEIGRAHV